MPKKKSHTAIAEAWIRRIQKRANEDNVEQPIAPREFVECLRRSLCRVSAYLNRGRVSSFARPSDLSLDDDGLHAKMEGARYPKGTFANFHCAASLDDLASTLLPYDLASNFFYGSLLVDHPPEMEAIRRVKWTVTEEFLDKGYQGLHLPEYTEEEINPSSLLNAVLLQKCCTNYFVRNLWHNYVHTIHHRIGISTYRDFAGTARHAMDFEADNWSNILLVQSYGLQVRTDDTADGHADVATMTLLRQNKCNKLFSLRAYMRGESERFATANDLEHLDESEWRLRRTIAGYVSGWLISSGIAASHVTVFHRGGLHSKNGRPERNLDGIVVNVNGVQIHLTGTFGSPDYGEFKRQLKRIGSQVESAYKNALRHDSDLKTYATASFDAMNRRLAPA